MKQVFLIFLLAALQFLSCSKKENEGTDRHIPPTPPPSQPAAIAPEEPTTPTEGALETKAIKFAPAKPIKLSPYTDLPAPLSVSSRTYSIQLAAYPDGELALKTANALLKSGLPTAVFEADLGSRGVWYRVRTGVFTGKTLAEEYANLILKEKGIRELVPHTGEFAPIVVENEGATNSFVKLVRLLQSEALSFTLIPTMDIYGEGYPAFFAARKEGRLGIVSVDEMNSINFISTQIDWKNCRECRDIPIDGSGLITAIYPLGLMNKLKSSPSGEFWLSIEVDSAHRIWQALAFEEGALKPLFALPSREWTSHRPSVKRELYFEDLNGDGVNEVLVTEVSYSMWERQLCSVWKSDYIFVKGDNSYNSLKLSNFDEEKRYEYALETGEEMKKRLLEDGRFGAMAAIALLEASKAETEEKAREITDKLADSLTSKKCYMNLIRFLLHATELPKFSEETKAAMRENALDELDKAVRGARIIYKPSCDETPLVADFLPSERGQEKIEKYLGATSGMIAPSLLTSGDISRLGGAFKASKKDREALRKNWLSILRGESETVFKLMRLSLEKGNE